MLHRESRPTSIRNYQMGLTPKIESFVTQCLNDASVLGVATTTGANSISAERIRQLSNEEGQNWSNAVEHAYMERRHWSDWPESRLGLALLMFKAQLLVNHPGTKWVARWVTVVDPGTCAEVPGLLLYRSGDQAELPAVPLKWGLDKPFIVELELSTIEQQLPPMPPEEPGVDGSIIVLEEWLEGSECTPMRNYLDREYIKIDVAPLD